MAEEDTGSHANGNAASEPSELDAALKELYPGKESDELKPEDHKKVQDLVAQRERSATGRRVKKLEEMLEKNVATKADVQEIRDLVASLKQPSREPVHSSIDDEDIRPDDVVTTFQDLDKYENAKKKKQLKYEDDFFLERDSYKRDPDYTEIVALMENDRRFNIRHTGNGRADGKVNYLEAKTFLLDQKISGKKPNVRSERRPDSSSFQVESTNTERSEPDADLSKDEYAMNFIKSTGMSDKSVKEALKGFRK